MSYCSNGGKRNNLLVGESGTLYRFLKFASWKHDLKLNLVTSGTLSKRAICDNPEIISWGQQDLLTLDHGTSQWASAAVIAGSEERIARPPYKLRLTYEAVEHWKLSNGVYAFRWDEIIRRQAALFVIRMQGISMGISLTESWTSEDYCFLRVFGAIDHKLGKSWWPSLVGHESDRITVMEELLKKPAEPVTVRDHRIVQALAMRGKVTGEAWKFVYPECVSKSWSRFWDFLSAVDEFIT